MLGDDPVRILAQHGTELVTRVIDRGSSDNAPVVPMALAASPSENVESVVWGLAASTTPDVESVVPMAPAGVPPTFGHRAHHRSASVDARAARNARAGGKSTDHRSASADARAARNARAGGTAPGHRESARASSADDLGNLVDRNLAFLALSLGGL